MQLNGCRSFRSMLGSPDISLANNAYWGIPSRRWDANAWKRQSSSAEQLPVLMSLFGGEMSLLRSPLQPPSPGFSFDLTERNAVLGRLLEGSPPPRPVKTGTTISGMVFRDGVVLGADTRATSGDVVADKMCAKIHRISANMYCCGAGTAADTQKTTDLLASNLALFSLNSQRAPRVLMAASILQDTLYRYGGQIGAHLILGGVDYSGAHLYTVGPYGSVDKLPFVSMGSGSMAALGILEDRYKPNMEVEEAKVLVRDSVQAGIMGDLGSGSNVDLCVITAQAVDYIRPYQESQYTNGRNRKYKYPPGTTALLSEKVVPLRMELVTEAVQRMETH
ncbi:unnamed protein product [Gadus morhua 'NCC']